MKNLSLMIGMYCLGIYFIISQIMVIYFWYKVAQVSSFAYTVFIGPFEAELKGLLWPFFI